jgi:hypothetical protein
MNQGSKIAVTVLLIIVFFILAAFLIAADFSKAFVGLIGLGLFYGIRTMWKKPKESSSEIKLDKTQKSENENTKN